MTLLWRLYVTWTKRRKWKCRKSAGNCRKSIGNSHDIFCPVPFPLSPFDFHRSSQSSRKDSLTTRSFLCSSSSRWRRSSEPRILPVTGSLEAPKAPFQRGSGRWAKQYSHAKFQKTSGVKFVGTLIWVAVWILRTNKNNKL